jgi:hypothetical protein
MENNLLDTLPLRKKISMARRKLIDRFKPVDDGDMNDATLLDEVFLEIVIEAEKLEDNRKKLIEDGFKLIHRL